MKGCFTMLDDSAGDPRPAIAMLDHRGRLTYGTLKRQFQLDDAALDDLKNELIEGQRLAVDERGKVLVWTGDTAATTARAPLPRQTGSGPADLHAAPSRRQDPGRPHRPGRRAQAGHRALCRPQGLDRTHPGARSRSRPAAPRSGAPPHDGRRAPLRGHGESGARRWQWPCLVPPLPTKTTPCAPAMPPWPCRPPCTATEAVRRTRGLELRMRVGLNSGEVVVRAIGNDLHMDYSAVGETTVLAARMEQMATPGSIRLTAGTLGLVEGLVRVHALGPVPVKGLLDPVEVFELVGVSRCGGAYRPPPRGD